MQFSLTFSIKKDEMVNNTINYSTGDLLPANHLQSEVNIIKLL